MGRKRGALSTEERKFFIDYGDTLSVSEIAEQLNRSESFVRKNLASIPKRQQVMDQHDFVHQLHASPFWAEVKMCLLSNEIPYFERQWAAYMQQFSVHDIVATDEMMTKDLIMSDIMCNRCLQKQARTLEEIRSLETKIANEMKHDMMSRDAVQLQEWTARVAALNAVGVNTSKELGEHQSDKVGWMKALKGTREARYKNEEASRRNFFELIKKLDDLKERQREGAKNAKVAEASKRIKEDWQEYFEYEDGTVDAPLLNPEGVLKHE